LIPPLLKGSNLREIGLIELKAWIPLFDYGHVILFDITPAVVALLAIENFPGTTAIGSVSDFAGGIV